MRSSSFIAASIVMAGAASVIRPEEENSYRIRFDQLPDEVDLRIRENADLPVNSKVPARFLRENHHIRKVRK